MRTDFNNLINGQRIKLHPTKDNPIHKKPVIATYNNGYFYCDGARAEDGPDYYWRDISLYHRGFTEVEG